MLTQIRDGYGPVATASYSQAEAARMLDVPTSTFAAWARGYTKRRPGRPDVIGARVVTAVTGAPGP